MAQETQTGTLYQPRGMGWGGRGEGGSKGKGYMYTYGWFHALEKEMATHSSVLGWRIPGTEEPGGLLSMGSHRVGHDWSDLAAAAWLIHVEVLQKTTKFCKAIIPQLKNKEIKKKKTFVFQYLSFHCCLSRSPWNSLPKESLHKLHMSTSFHNLQADTIFQSLNNFSSPSYTLSLK